MTVNTPIVPSVEDELELAKSNFCLLRMLADKQGDDADCSEQDAWAWLRILRLCDEGYAALEAADKKLASANRGAR